MLTAYGIRVRSVSDGLQPALRERKIIIPRRDGAYDYGAQWYDERELRLTCEIVQKVPRADFRELSLTLSRKGRITLWQEPDKYYVGRLYDTSNLELIGRIGHRFELPFVCEPFAYGAQQVLTIDGATKPAYAGTARTPMRIVIRNTGSTPITGIQIRTRERTD